MKLVEDMWEPKSLLNIKMRINKIIFVQNLWKQQIKHPKWPIKTSLRNDENNNYQRHNGMANFSWLIERKGSPNKEKN